MSERLIIAAVVLGLPLLLVAAALLAEAFGLPGFVVT